MDLQDRREYSVSLHGSAKDAHIAELEAENQRLVNRVAELENLVVALAEKEGE